MQAVQKGQGGLHGRNRGWRRAEADEGLRRGPSRRRPHRHLFARRRHIDVRHRRDPRANTQALDAVIAQRGGGADDVAAEAEDGSGRGRVVEQLAELLLTLNAGTADSVGSSRRRQSVLPFEPFPYPKFDPAALAGQDESSDEEESESGGESASA